MAPMVGPSELLLIVGSSGCCCIAAAAVVLVAFLVLRNRTSEHGEPHPPGG